MALSEATNRIGYASTVAWLQSIIDGLFAKAAADTADSTEHLECAAARATHLFAQALHEDSNLELDWLWYAANMPSIAERRYCVERALAINLHSSLARSALANLPKQAAQAHGYSTSDALKI